MRSSQGVVKGEVNLMVADLFSFVGQGLFFLAAAISRSSTIAVIQCRSFIRMRPCWNYGIGDADRLSEWNDHCSKKWGVGAMTEALVAGRRRLRFGQSARS